MALHCDHWSISISLTVQPKFVIDYLQRSNQITLGQNLGKKGLTHVSQTLIAYDLERLVVCKINRVGIFCRLSTMHERDKQTERQTDRQRDRP